MPESPTNTGKQFERVIAGLYRELGARKVEHDVEIEGHQIDVYVEFDLPEKSVHRIAIEAKDRASPVGIKIVSNFSRLVRQLREHGRVESGVMIAEKGFTRPARNHAKGLSFFRLLELADLSSLATETAPKPDVRVVPDSCVPVTDNHYPNNPKAFLCVKIQNRSSQTVFIQGLAVETTDFDGRLLIQRDAFTNQPLRRRKLSPGESYIIALDPGDFFDRGTQLEDLDAIIATDDVEREYRAGKADIESAISKLRSWYPNGDGV